MNENEIINTANEPIDTTKEENGQLNMNSSQGPIPNKKKNNWIVPVIAIVAVISIITILALVYISYIKPENFYKRLISSTFDSYVKQSKETQFESYKGSVKFDLDVKTEDELIDEEILDLINELEIELGTQINKVDKQLVVDILSDYNKENILDLQLFVDAKNEETYLYAKEYINKYLKIELEDEKMYSSFEELFDIEGIEQDEKDKLEKVNNIFEEEINKNLIKSEYCSAEKAIVKVNDKDVNVTKNTIKLTSKQFAKAFSTLFENLTKNEEFLNLFDEEGKEEIIDILENNAEEIEDSLEGIEDSIIKINTYTTGLTQKVVKFEIATANENGEDVATLAFTKLDDAKYSFEVQEENESILTGKFSLENNEENKGTIELEIKIEEVGTLELNIEFEQEYNANIDKVDKDKIISIDELTEQEQMDIMQKLQESKLYELIEKFSSEFSSYDQTEDDDSIVINGEEDDVIDIDDVYNDDYTDEDIDEDTDNNEDSITSSLQDNQIKTYDDAYLITFGIPSGYKPERISDNYQTLIKGNNVINVSTDSYNEDEYYEFLESYKEYISEKEYYKNVTLSEKEVETIDGKEIYHATLKYDYEYSENYIESKTETYYWAKISDENVLEIVVYEYDEITQDEIEELLKFSISAN